MYVYICMFVLCTPVPVSWIMLKVQIYTYSAVLVHVVLDTLIPPQRKIHSVWYINFMYMCISTCYIDQTGITCQSELFNYCVGWVSIHAWILHTVHARYGYTLLNFVHIDTCSCNYCSC